MGGNSEARTAAALTASYLYIARELPEAALVHDPSRVTKRTIPTGEAELTRLQAKIGLIGGGTGFRGAGLRSMSVERRRAMVDRSHPQLSIMRQCALFQISRSGHYYQPVGESEPTLALMQLIDEAFLDYPCDGSHGKN